MPSWVWWLVAALLIAAAVALPLVLRSRRRGRWRAELHAAEEEVAWFARVLLPDLRAARTAEAIGGGWLVSEERIAATEDKLTAMAASAPDAQAGDRASTLRDGVRDARTRIRALIASATPSAAAELDAVITDLEAVLAPATASTPPTA